MVLPIVRPTRSRLNRMFDNILRGLVAEFRTQHSAPRTTFGHNSGKNIGLLHFYVNSVLFRHPFEGLHSTNVGRLTSVLRKVEKNGLPD